LMDLAVERKTENVVFSEVLVDPYAAWFSDEFFQLILLFSGFCMLYVYFNVIISLAMMKSIR
jgi:hypothetical protein